MSEIKNPDGSISIGIIEDMKKPEPPKEEPAEKPKKKTTKKK